MSSADFDRLSPCFEFDDGTQVHRSSSVTWRNNFFIFGSELHPKQISKVIGYKLTLIGQLSFNHEYGSASVMGEGVVLIYFWFFYRTLYENHEDLIFLCFQTKKIDHKKCRVGSDPLGTFEEISPSQYPHSRARTSASDSRFIFWFSKFNFLSTIVGSRGLLYRKPESWTLRSNYEELVYRGRLSVCRLVTSVLIIYNEFELLPYKKMEIIWVTRHPFTTINRSTYSVVGEVPEQSAVLLRVFHSANLYGFFLGEKPSFRFNY